MARPKLDPSGLDSKAPKERIAIFVPRSVRQRYEAIWEREKASSDNPKDFDGFGSWLGWRVESLLEAEESGYRYTPTQALPDENQDRAEMVLIPDTERLASEILAELKPELSDVLRRSSFSAMQRVGKETKEELTQAMIDAVQIGLAGTSVPAAQHAAEIAVTALIPEIRKLTAAVNALSAPVEIWEGPTH